MSVDELRKLLATSMGVPTDWVDGVAGGHGRSVMAFLDDKHGDGITILEQDQRGRPGVIRVERQEVG